MTLEESRDVIPMMESMIGQIEEQQNIMAEMLRELQEKDEQLTYYQEQEERLQQLENGLSELLQILPDTEELLILLEEQADRIRNLTSENQQRQAEQERDYALSHQKKVEIPVEKPVLYEKCKSCNQTAYQKAKDKYERQRGKLAARYKSILFLLAWYSLTTTIFQAVLSETFITDCRIFFNTSTGILQKAAEWVIYVGKQAAQVSNGIAIPVISAIVYWLIRILIVGDCAAGVGVLAVFSGIKIAEFYKKNCWDILTIMVTLAGMAVVIYFGEFIKTILPVNLLLLLLLVQVIYVGIKCYVKGCREARGYY